MNSELETARATLWRFFKREGRLPSYGEMSRLFGYASKFSAVRLAKKLIEAGILSKGEGGRLAPKQLSVPLKVLGSVQAGFPSPAEEELVDTLTLDAYLIKKPEATYLLRVSGDSMIEAGILPDDLVIVERGPKPKNGDIVLAEIDHEWTLKYFEKRGEKIRLVAANKNYPPLYPKQELQIGGIVRAVVRKY